MGGTKRGVSLKARGKRPLRSLNAQLTDQLKQVPRLFLIGRFRRLITAKVPDAPRWLVEEFATHLATSPAEPFSWTEDDRTDEDIDLEISAEEVMAVFEEGLRFATDELPHVVAGAGQAAAKTLLKSLKADWPAQREYDAMRMADFDANLKARWGEAFGTLRMMYTIAVEIASDLSKARRRSRSVRNAALNDTVLRMHARACQVTFEVITLIEAGLADGAMARWRTLHEITVVTSLLVEHGEELAIRFRSHEAVEAKRAMDRYVRNHAQLGEAPPTARQIARTDAAYEAALERFGHSFGQEYGWAAHHLRPKKPRFVDLEEAAGKGPMQSAYRMASYNVHAGPKGIGFRLGSLKGEGALVALAGASNAGFVDPAQNTAWDLVHMTTLLSSGTARFDRMIEWHILLLLRDELIAKLAKAQRELDRAHRLQVAAERGKRGRRP